MAEIDNQVGTMHRRKNSSRILPLFALLIMNLFIVLQAKVVFGQEQGATSLRESADDASVLEFDGTLGRVDLNPRFYLKLALPGDAEKQDFNGIAAGHYDNLILKGNALQPGVGQSRRWFRILLHNPTDVEQKVILANALPQGSLYVLEGHTPDKILIAGNHHIFYQDPLSISPAVKITLKPGLNRIYLGTYSRGNINFFMMSLWRAADFEEYEKERLTFFAICFGAFIALWVYNLVLYLLMRQKVYFYYILFCTGLLLIEGIIGGAPLIFGSHYNGDLQQYWPAAITLALVGFSLFASEFTDLTIDQKKPWARSINIGLGLMILSAFGYYLGISVFATAILVSAGVVILLLTANVYRILLTSVETYYLLVSCIPLIVSSIMLILQISLVMNFNFRIIWFQVGSALLHVILVSTALGAKANSDRIEKVRLQSSIDLGRIIQDLLLPKRMKAHLDAFDYAFCYVPRQGSLSGDWINHWTTKDGAIHFILGSVQGEKVQAALAVASIATVIERARDLDHSLEFCLKDINDTLLHLFSSRIGTKASGVSVFKDGAVKFWNFGGAGWCVQRVSQSNLIIKNEGILGKSELHIGPGVLMSLADIGMFYVFSDGFARDQQSLLSLREQLVARALSKVTSDDLCKLALDISAGQGRLGPTPPEEDRSMLVVSSKKSAEGASRAEPLYDERITR